MAKRTRGVCSVTDCGLPHAAKSYCSIHYYRLRKTGHLHKTQVRWNGPCHVDGCDRPILARGLCGMHYDRQRRSGNIGPAQSRRRKRSIGDTRINKDGYVLVYRPDYPGIRRPHYVQRHRLVMEEMLGRRLRSFETPHHLNGIRHDNRPENLELWTRPQPAGQRPEDLVEWVLEFYRDLVVETLKKT